jgi:hypothetical protein
MYSAQTLEVSNQLHSCDVRLYQVIYLLLLMVLKSINRGLQNREQKDGQVTEQLKMRDRTWSKP